MLAEAAEALDFLNARRHQINGRTVATIGPGTTVELNGTTSVFAAINPVATVNGTFRLTNDADAGMLEFAFEGTVTTDEADQKTAAIPVLALTAHASLADRDAALDAGCTAWMTKPLDTRLLTQTLLALL